MNGKMIDTFLDNKMELTREELKEKIIDNFDPDDLVDLMNITSEELVEALDYKLEERCIRKKFMDYFEEEE